MPYVTIPSDIVSALLADHTATRDELNAIRDPRQPSRFQGVYGHRHGGVYRGDNRYVVKAYRARVFKFFELGSSFESPEAGARAVVAFYKAYFGEHWRTAFRYRKVTPWRLRERSDGYAVDIFVKGRPVGITRADTGEGKADQWTWPCTESAKRAARLAMSRRFDRERPNLVIPAPGLLFWRA